MKSTDLSKPEQTIHLRRFLNSVDALEHCYCITFTSVQRFYAWASQMPLESPIQFTYLNSNQPWHEPITNETAQKCAPVVSGCVHVNTVITLAMWMEYYLRDMCRVLYNHTHDGTWLMHPKLHQVDWKMVEGLTGVKFEDVQAHEALEKIFEIRDFAFKYAEETPDPGIPQDSVLRLLLEARRFAIDFEAAFFIEHADMNPLTVGTDMDRPKRKLLK